MSYLEEFQAHIKNHDFKKFLKLWKEVCSSEHIDSEEFIQLLTMTLSSEFANPIGKFIEIAIPLWRGIEYQKDAYKIIGALIDLQTTNSPTLAEISYQVLENRYGDDPKFEERIHWIGLANRNNFQGAISKYELLMHLERGNLVIHKEGWKKGEVREVCRSRNEVTIEFENDIGIKHLSIEKALKTLLPIYYNKPNKLLMPQMADSFESEEKVKKNPLLMLKKLLKGIRRKNFST